MTRSLRLSSLIPTGMAIEGLAESGDGIVVRAYAGVENSSNWSLIQFKPVSRRMEVGIREKELYQPRLRRNFRAAIAGDLPRDAMFDLRFALTCGNERAFPER